MSDQYGGHYAQRQYQPQQYAPQQYDAYGDGYEYDRRPPARQARAHLDPGIATEGGADGKGTAAAGVLGAIGILCALLEVLFCALSPLWLQDILCLLAICFGAYSFASSTARSDRWRSISAMVIGGCSLVGTMSMHAIASVIIAAL